MSNKVCKFCGETLEDNEIFCKGCGAKNDRDEEIKDAVIENDKAKKKETNFLLKIIVFLLLLIVVIGALLILFKK